MWLNTGAATPLIGSGTGRRPVTQTQTQYLDRATRFQHTRTKVKAGAGSGALVPLASTTPVSPRRLATPAEAPSQVAGRERKAPHLSRPGIATGGSPGLPDRFERGRGPRMPVRPGMGSAPAVRLPLTIKARGLTRFGPCAGPPPLSQAIGGGYATVRGAMTQGEGEPPTPRAALRAEVDDHGVPWESPVVVAGRPATVAGRLPAIRAKPAHLATP